MRRPPRTPARRLAPARLALLVLLALAPLACGGAEDGRADRAGGPPFERDAETGTTDTTVRSRPRLRDETDSVLVLGDSLTNGARLFGDLGDRLDASGFDELEIVAVDGVDTPWGLATIEERDRVPEIVIVELGTNPDAEEDGFQEAAEALVVALRERGAERIAWITPVHGRDDRYDDKVAILESLDDLDTVADWAAEVRRNPRRLAADGLHPTEEGYADLAEFMTDTAVDLAR
jgi:lysophospholipase L1-like esterase